MSFVSSLVVLVVVWWVVWFAMLPQGVEDEAKSATGAPRRPGLKRKAAITTAIALAVWAVAYLVFSSGVISLREIFG